MAPSRAAQLQSVATAISDRLLAWTAVATDITSSEYFYEARNGLAVIRLEIRDELCGLVDRDSDLFAHEHTVLVLVERDSCEALMWDKGGYDETLGDAGVTHYLCDLSRAAEILDALMVHPVVTDDERTALAREYTARSLSHA